MDLKVCVNIANGLVKRGWNIELVCLNLEKKKKLNKIFKKIKFINLNSKSSLGSLIGIFFI